MIRTAERLDNMQQSAIRAMSQRCEAVGGINLGQGLCRTPPPPSLLQHSVERIRSVNHSYSLAQGDQNFRKAVARKMAVYNGLEVEPETQIVVTIGASGAFNAALLAFLNPGDGILLPEPYYGYHLAAARLYGLEPQPIPLTPPGYRLERTALEEAVTERTRAIVVCTPANPTGRRLDCEELETVAAVAQEHDLLVITDEIYEHIYYNGRPHLSPATVDGLWERTITISGLSKTYSIPGWRLGYAAGPTDLIKPLRVVADILSVCAPTPLQQLAVHALTLPDSYYQSLRDMYQDKRKRLTSAFESSGLSVNTPDGAYYLLVDCSALGVPNGWAAAEFILDRARVATVPGEAFYLTSPPHPSVRVCLSVEDRTIERATEQLDRLRLA
jgi:aminotransferase